MISKEVIFEMQREIRNSIHSLNNGGCIQFAYYFSKSLKEAHIPCKILFTDVDPIDIRYQYFYPVCHILVYIPNIGYIDGYDFYPTQKSYFDRWDNERYKCQTNVSCKKLNHFRNNYWNQRYSRNQNTKLEKIIQKHINGSRKRIYQKRRGRIN